MCIADHRRNQPAINRHSHRDMRAIMIGDTIIRIGRITIWLVDQRQSRSLDQHVVDGNFDPLARSRINTFAGREQFIQPQIHGQWEMGHLHKAFGQAAGHRAAHPVERDKLVAFRVVDAVVEHLRQDQTIRAC